MENNATLKAREILARHVLPNSRHAAEAIEAGQWDTGPEMRALIEALSKDAEIERLRAALENVRTIAKRGTMGPGPWGPVGDFKFIIELVDDALNPQEHDR